MEKMTIEQLSESIANDLAVYVHNPLSIDFCTGDDDNFAGWHGIKSIITGFDSDEVLLVADYYGGCSMVTGKIDSEMDADDIFEVVQNMIIGTLENMEDGINSDTMLMIDM